MRSQLRCLFWPSVLFAEEAIVLLLHHDEELHENKENRYIHTEIKLANVISERVEVSKRKFPDDY